MENTNENVKKFLRMIQDNPDLPVVPLVNYEIVLGDDFRRWLGSFGDCRIGEYVDVAGNVYFKNAGDKAEVLGEILGEDELDQLTLNEISKRYESLPWIKAVFVYIDTFQM